MTRSKANDSAKRIVTHKNRTAPNTGTFDFTSIKLETAHLEGANLGLAHLEGADFGGANFEGTDLRKANLQGANLREVNLEETDLKEAKNLMIDQLSKVKTLYNAELDESLRAVIEEKYPALFEKPE